MMNTALLKQGFSLARDIFDRVNEYREEKQREAYEVLREAAEQVNVDELKGRGTELFDDTRREAGALTQAAHRRLDQARAELTDRAQQTGKQVDSAKTRMVDRVTGKEAKRQARKKRTRRALTTTGIIALLAAIAGAVYYFFFGPGKKAEPDTAPPRVEEHSGEKEANLVYSTSTDGGSAAGPLSEEPAERDEELLTSIDEQLATLADDGGEQEQPEDQDELDALKSDAEKTAEELEAEIDKELGKEK
ncbi:hypothetical protein QP027_11690 [Corynebacterium breve]|uniref:Uncharacterized protein n=1 Tax=Corynebacterium breve TaxID=3049799 RepID=A0ABY8VDH5_9CORY|nr:hypothetical protein [Corynebacterium breve]WIM67721.1 hypothetical protein QP027_11690 [Corynebacterium breve]